MIYKFHRSHDGYTFQEYYFKTNYDTLTQKEADEISDLENKDDLGYRRISSSYVEDLTKGLRKKGYEAYIISEDSPEIPFNKEYVKTIFNVSANY